MAFKKALDRKFCCFGTTKHSCRAVHIMCDAIELLFVLPPTGSFKKMWDSRFREAAGPDRAVPGLGVPGGLDNGLAAKAYFGHYSLHQLQLLCWVWHRK